MFFGTMEDDFGMRDNNGTEKAVAVAATAYVIYSLEGGASRINDRLTPKRIGEQEISVHESGTKRDSNIIKDGAISTKEQDTKSSPYPGKGLSPKPAREVLKPDLPTTKPSREVPKSDLSTREVPKPDLATTKPSRQVPKPDVPAIKPAREVPKPDLATTKPARDVRKPDPSTIKPGRDTTKRDTASSLKPVEQAGVETDQKHRPISIESAKVADDWERAEMTKVKEWYENLNWTISSWEEKQKAKARHKLDSRERESDPGGREKASHKYRRDMEYIEEVVRGARAEAEEKRRRKELRVKEKANLIRTTGKVPMTCFCF